jgi:RNA polymerase sigma-70 factor (ECF subfamily)
VLALTFAALVATSHFVSKPDGLVERHFHSVPSRSDGSREIDLQELDPQEDDRRSTLPGPSGGSTSSALPEFSGARDHDSARLSEFAHNDFAAVCRIVSVLCGHKIDAEGAVAEAMARAIEQLAAHRSIEALTPWITRVALNLGRSELRREAVRRRKAPLVSLPTQTDAGFEAIASRLDLQRALKRLTRRQAEVVALYYGLDLNVDEVARTLGRSPGTVKTTLSKARLRLSQSLELREEDDNDVTT